MTAPSLEEVADRVVALALARPPTLGAGRLVAVDGPAGAGKTTFGDALRRAAAPPATGGVDLLRMDDVYEGWSGLATGMEQVASQVVGPLRAGEPGRYRRYDWHRGALAEEHVVDPVALLLMEGVGSGNATYAEAITVLVWVEAPPGIRLARGLERDGEEMRDHWLAWRVEEDAMLAEHRTRERADVLVDGLRR